MKKIYIDITQLYEWQGQVTGIQRVMEEISRRFANDEDFDPTYVTWNKNRAAFMEIDFAMFLRQRETALDQPADEGAKPTKIGRQKAKAAALLKRTYHHVPLSRTMHRYYSVANGKLLVLTGVHKEVEITNDSLFFMPHGGVWESKAYINEIISLKQLKNVKLITVLYDLCPVLTPQFVVQAVNQYFGSYMKQVLPQSDLVLAISENTAKDAAAWLNSLGHVDLPDIKVFRLGDEIGKGSTKPANVPDDYILCVGTVEARKNHLGLYLAYKLAASEKRQLPPIVVAGRLGWLAGDTYQLITTDPDTKERFHFITDASDDELAWLYGHALFSIYPSFYEGWGLPIAESLLRGTPCIVSETSSMKEVAGELVDYFSPYSPDQIKDSIESYLANPDRLSDLKSRIKKNYKATSWDASYDQVAKAIQDL